MCHQLSPPVEDRFLGDCPVLADLGGRHGTRRGTPSEFLLRQRSHGPNIAPGATDLAAVRPDSPGRFVDYCRGAWNREGRFGKGERPCREFAPLICPPPKRPSMVVLRSTWTSAQ